MLNYIKKIWNSKEAKTAGLRTIGWIIVFMMVYILVWVVCSFIGGKLGYKIGDAICDFIIAMN